MTEIYETLFTKNYGSANSMERHIQQKTETGRDRQKYRVVNEAVSA